MPIKFFFIYRRFIPLALEAYYDLIVCKLAILFLPFRWYAKSYGQPHCESLKTNMLNNVSEFHAIKHLFQKIPRYLPWHSKCLDQAMAAQRMLKRRGLMSTLYFGVTHEADHGLLAHAWLRCGEHWVIGYQPEKNYTVVRVYSWLGRYNLGK